VFSRKLWSQKKYDYCFWKRSNGACVCVRACVRACQYLLREIRRITKEAGGDRGRTCQIRHSMSGTSLFCLHIVIYLYLYYSTVPVLKSKLPCTYRHIPFFLNLFFVANILKLCNNKHMFFFFFFGVQFL
jgi:hypothetical protein